MLSQDILKLGYSYGLSFHVGSQCLDSEDFEFGLRLARQALARINSDPRCIDVGGVFPARYVNS